MQYEPTPEAEQEDLRRHKELLTAELGQLEKRLEELEARAEKKK